MEDAMRENMIRI